eukprot:s2503_g1.t1
MNILNFDQNQKHVVMSTSCRRGAAAVRHVVLTGAITLGLTSHVFATIALRRPLVLAPKEDCEGAVLWLHGFDDNSAGWSQLLPRQLNTLPEGARWCWVHLRAPKVAQSFFGGRKMAAWGDFHSAARIEVGSEDHECSDERGIYATCSRLVQQELNRVQQKYHLDSTRVIVAGYSQVPEEPALVPHAAHTHSAPHTVHGVDDKPSGAVGMVAGLLHIDPRRYSALYCDSKAPGVQKDAEADVESIGRCTPASCVGRSKQTAGGHEPAELPPLKKRKVSPAKVGVPGADFPDKSKQCRGKANFGGKVTSLPHCAVCTVLRHHEFHGNICLLCEQTMRARNQRAWRKLSEEDRKSIAAESQRKRAESLSDEDAKKVAIISEQVRLLLFGRIEACDFFSFGELQQKKHLHRVSEDVSWVKLTKDLHTQLLRKTWLSPRRLRSKKGAEDGKFELPKAEAMAKEPAEDGKKPEGPKVEAMAEEPQSKQQRLEHSDDESGSDESVADKLKRLEAEISKLKCSRASLTPAERRKLYTRNPDGTKTTVSACLGCKVSKLKLSAWYLVKGNPSGRWCKTCRKTKANERNQRVRAKFAPMDVD